MKKLRNLSFVGFIWILFLSSIGNGATQPEWRCSQTESSAGSNQSQTARFTIKPSHRGDGTWIASVDECPLNSAYPCGGIQALVDQRAPDPEDSGDSGWVNYYQHGFPRKIASISIVEKSDGTHEGRLFTTQGATDREFTCVAEYTSDENKTRE
jgi:hypothetical protein